MIVGYLYHRTRQIRETIIVFRCFSFDFRRQEPEEMLEYNFITTSQNNPLHTHIRFVQTAEQI